VSPVPRFASAARAALVLVAFATSGGCRARVDASKAPPPTRASSPSASTSSTPDTAITSASPSRAPTVALPPLPAPSWRADGLHPAQLGPWSSRDRSDACARCHAAIAREWRGSLHRRAWDDAYFQAAFAIEATPFCRGCHAPIARDAAPDAEAAEEGVSCAICHVRGDAIVSATPAAPKSPHRVIVDPAFASPSACAGCHEFPFPVLLAHEPAEALPTMQRTIEEWRGSDAAAREVGCGDCHMPWVCEAGGARHHSHAFPGVSLLDRHDALRVEASAARDLRDRDQVVVTLTLRAGRVGHAVPTGDLFRALRIELSAGGRVRDRAELGRVYREIVGPGAGRADGADVVVRREVRDDRVPADGSREVVLRVRAAPGDRLAWTASHLRARATIAAIDHVDVGATEIARGELFAP
jgi:hypothetical protein